MTKKKKFMFRIPLLMRFIETSRSFNEKCIEVDGVGIFVRYDKEEELTPDNIRRRLIGLRDTYAIIEADSTKEAKTIFHEQWDAAKIGTKQKALWINEKAEILKYKRCKYLNQDKYGHYVCGEIDEYTQGGEYGGCALEGYDVILDDCPLNKNV